MKLWQTILVGILVGGVIGGILGQYYYFNISYGRSMNLFDKEQKCMGIIQKTDMIDERGDYVCFNDVWNGGVCHICQKDYSGTAQYICWGYNPGSVISYIYKNQIIGRLIWEWCI